MNIRVLIAALVAAIPVATIQAQDAYPSKPITFVVPQAAGGANDIIARIVAQKVSEQIGQAVVVDNRPGAGGNIGTAHVAKGPADGYTFLFTVSSAHVINPALYKNAGFDPVKDFTPIATVATAGYVLVANPGFAPRNVAELVSAAKAKPDSIMFASAGNGTLNHLIVQMLQSAAGISLVHVPYKGAAAAVTDVVAGQVPLSVQSLPSSMSFINAGRLKVLGVTNEKRFASMPDVPAVGETLKGFGATPWYGLFAPARTPKTAILRLQAEVAKALASRDLQDKLIAQGCEVYKTTPEQFAALVQAELPRWATIVKSAGATLD